MMAECALLYREIRSIIFLIMNPLQEQIEKIIDMGEGDRRDVIVRIKSRDEERESFVRLAAEAIHQRNLSLSARDVLPPARRPAKRPGASFPRDSKGFSSQLSHARLTTMSARNLRTRAFGRLDSHLKDPIVNRAAREGARSPAQRGKVQSFWTSKSMRLNLSKDDLARLPESMPEAQGVYLNRWLRVPKLVKTKNLPVSKHSVQVSAHSLRRVSLGMVHSANWVSTAVTTLSKNPK